jgi:hypothetical protein
MDLYTDKNPKTTIKGTGFKDKAMAEKTIKIIANRSIIYQKALVNTMYNRAKYHPNKTEDMETAMLVFKSWLTKNKAKNRKYEYLPLTTIKKYEKLADDLDVSRVSRGKEPSTKSDYGFLVMYKKVKAPNKLSFIPVKKVKPAGNDYDSQREKFLNARIKQVKKLYDIEGNPTKAHLLLIMNGYSPDKKLYK